MQDWDCQSAIPETSQVGNIKILTLVRALIRYIPLYIMKCGHCTPYHVSIYTLGNLHKVFGLEVNIVVNLQ